MGTCCAPLIADLFLFSLILWPLCLIIIKKLEGIQAFYPSSKYLDDLLNIDNPFFGVIMAGINPSEHDNFDFDILIFSSF